VPNSILWIGLVLLWLFVLFPMLADRHPRIRRITDAALSTRVLHRGGEEDPADFDQPAAVRRREPVPDPEDGFVPDRRGRGGYDPAADALARTARYRFRQRMLLALLLGVVTAGVAGAIVDPLLWWAGAFCGVAAVGCLGYLRHQVRVEEEIRRRRSARIARGRVVEPQPVRPAVPLDIDDEDPAFWDLPAPRTRPYAESEGDDSYARAVGE
jgi:hypothetical protein